MTDPQGRSPETQTGNSSNVEFIIDIDSSYSVYNTSVVRVSFTTGIHSLTPSKLGVERRVSRRGSDWQTRRRQRRSNGPMPYDQHCNDVATIEAPSLRRDPLLVTVANY